MIANSENSDRISANYPLSDGTSVGENQQKIIPSFSVEIPFVNSGFTESSPPSIPGISIT